MRSRTPPTSKRAESSSTECHAMVKQTPYKLAAVSPGWPAATGAAVARTLENFGLIWQGIIVSAIG